MNNESLLFLLLGVCGIIVLLLLPESKKNTRQKHLSNVLFSEKKQYFKNETQQMKHFLGTLTTYKPNVDETDKLKKELKMSGALAVGILFLGLINSQLLISFLAALAMLTVPLLIRWSNKQEYLREYKNSFFNVINYLILYLSGGLNIQKALEETEALIPEKDVIKTNLKMVVNERKLSGVSGNTIIESLQILNKGYDLSEISNFILTLQLAQKKGNEVTTSLQSQVTYINNQNTVTSMRKIDAAAVKISLFKTAFGVMTCVALFILPPILNAFAQISASGF